MSETLPHVYIGNNAIDQFIEYIDEHTLKSFTLVADENEYAALGRDVAAALQKNNSDVHSIILPGNINPDEAGLIQVLLEPDERERTYLAVGSGTLTDIVRFASHRAGMPFISFPTAPSVDGFASTGCSLTIRSYKQTIMAAQPVAIFADLQTLSRAPRPLIASGFGDMFGKYIALADWPIGNLINGEPFNQAIADRSRRALTTCVDQVPVLQTHWESAMQHLMEGLIEEGICMLLHGNSRPASGAEHVISHYLEMKLARENRPAVFHGSKVGLATILVAKYYETIRQIDRKEAMERLQAARLPYAESVIKQIQKVFGSAANLILAVQHDAIHQTPERFTQICSNVSENWGAIQQFASTVPTSGQIKELLRQVGGVTNPADLGLTELDIREALEYGHYLRTYFTTLNLSRLLGIPHPQGVY